MRSLIFAAFILEALFTSVLTDSASARTTMSREEIKAMPITQRPNRTGHFYGNTVRRRDHRAQ